jgi:hypothetical protein
VKNSLRGVSGQLAKKIDLSDRRINRSRALVKGKTTPENLLESAVAEFFKCEGLPHPEATLKSHGIECQD